MTDVKHRYRIFLLVLLTLLAACAPTQRNAALREADSVRVDELIAQVHIGEARKDVERTLGRPYNVGNDGRDTVMTYVTGPENAAADAESAQRAAASAQIFSTVLGTLGSIGGDSLGSVGSIGSQVINTGSTLGTSGGPAPISTEQTRIEVRLRGNKVVSVDRIDSGRVGIGTEH